LFTLPREDAAMVVRKRFTAILLPFLAYMVAFGAAGFFVFQAHHGRRGLENRKALKLHQIKLNAEYQELRRERGDWERRAALLRTDAVDRDMLEERVRHVLNRVHADDVVVILSPRR
jgi:cell division protein FtsB